MRSDGCNFRAFYGTWDCALQGSWNILYVLLEYVNCLNIQAHKCAPVAPRCGSQALRDTACTEPEASLDWRQLQLNHNETANRSSHEKGTPYATKISSTKRFSLLLILLRLWALKKTSNQTTNPNKQKNKQKKPPKPSSSGFLENTFDGTFT